MNADNILSYALAKQIDTANTLETRYGSLALDSEMAEAVSGALRPILQARLNANRPKSVGERVERLKLYGFADGQILSTKDRDEIIEFAMQFEECAWSRAELKAESDSGLVYCAYWVMAEYASGQI
jgi:hypothetical protein